MKEHFRTTLASVAILVAGLLVSTPARGADPPGSTLIPYPEALRDAGVAVSDMTNGQSESLIIGNGDLYGIAWEKEGGLFLRITKNDVWDARVDTSKDGPMPKVNIRTRAVTGSKGAPPSYDANSFPEPVCAAALRIGKSPVAQGALDLQRAVASIISSNGGKTDLRVLADRNVLLITTKEPVSIEPGRGGQVGTTNGVAWLHVTLPGDLDYKGMQYCVAVASESSTKVVSLITSFDISTGDVRSAAIALAAKAMADAARSPEQLIARHEKAWREFWARSGVELGDRDLQHWWYRMLYFARTISQPGGRFPAGIMPPLATDKTPWHADFHFNYNSWQPFWSVISPNHPELADPWISYVHSLLPRAQWQAKEVFDCEGVFYTISQFMHEPDPAVCKSVNKRSLVMNPWGMTIGMVGMTAQNLWHKHLCDPDRAYLEAKIYPSLREAARFCLSFMKQCGKDAAGKILLGPSYSPEHGAMGIDNCPFDIAYVHYTFDAFDKASKELGKDRALAAECLAMKALLADYPVALDPHGKPVVVDWAGCKYKEVEMHNLTVPVAPVFPAEQVTWFSPEPVKDLFRRTIRDTTFGDANSHVVFPIAKARLSMPEAVPEMKAWFKSRELPNGLFVWQGHEHGTFMPESIGVAAVVTEFLMQSVGDTIRVFPCWPKEQDANFTNLRAQGGFLVSAEQKNGKVEKLEITSTVGGSLRVLNPWSGQVVERATQPGQRVTFTGPDLTDFAVNPPTVQSMFYKARSPRTGNMWDTWVYFHEGTYYLYYLGISGNDLWDNVSMASSPDGVHWTEIGPVFLKPAKAMCDGSGSTWKSPHFAKDGKFFMNFVRTFPGHESAEGPLDLSSRLKNGFPPKTILFGESTDLIHWKLLDRAKYGFVPDTRWYEPGGAWDCISAIPRPGGGFYGYWTATPKAETGGTVGFGQTLDGVKWEALPPPKTPGVERGEIGGVAKIGEKFYMMQGHNFVMRTLIADQPQGPFLPATKNFRLLSGHTYFTRFLPTPDGLLVNHHAISSKPAPGFGSREVYFSPLKTAVLDDEGTLRLGWWKGNEKMKHEPVEVQLPGGEPGEKTPIVMLGNTFDTERGVILEGTLKLPDAGSPRRGLYIEYGPGSGSAILIDTIGAAELGAMKSDGSGFKSEKQVHREIQFGRPAAFRLLLKHSMLEFYLDDILIECFRLPGDSTGRIGLIRGSDSQAIGKLNACSCETRLAEAVGRDASDRLENEQ